MESHREMIVNILLLYIIYKVRVVWCVSVGVWGKMKKTVRR